MAGGVKVDISASSRRARREMTGFLSFLNRWAGKLVGRMARAGMNIGRSLVRGMATTVRRGTITIGALLSAGIAKSIKTSSDFQKAEVQLEALIGTAEGARERMRMLEGLALDVTFDFTSLILANRHLQVFTNGAMAGRDAMKMIADAASVTPNEIQDVAFWFGRAYAMIDSGRPMGEAVMRLTEMGLMSKEAANELKKLENSFNPKSQARKLQVLIDSLMRFEGANEKLILTLSGQFSMFRDASTLAFKEVGDAIAPLTMKWLRELIDKLKQLRKDGTLTRWGENISKSLDKVRSKAEETYGVLFGRFNFAKAHGATNIQSFGEAILGPANETADYVKKLLTNVLTAIGDWAEKNSESFKDIGLTIGESIAKGMWDGWVNFITKDKIQSEIRSNMPLGNLVGSASDVAGSVKGGSLDLAALNSLMKESYKLTSNALFPGLYGLTKAQMSMPTANPTAFEAARNRSGLNNKNEPILVKIANEGTP